MNIGFRLPTLKKKLYLLGLAIVACASAFLIAKTITKNEDVDASSNNNLASILPAQMTKLNLSLVYSGSLVDSTVDSSQSFAITDKYFVVVQANSSNENSGYLVATSFSNPSSTPAWTKSYNVKHGNGATYNSQTNQIIVTDKSTRFFFDANNGNYARSVTANTEASGIAYIKESNRYLQTSGKDSTSGRFSDANFNVLTTFDAGHRLVNQDAGYYGGYAYRVAWGGCTFMRNAEGRTSDADYCDANFGNNSNVIYAFDMNGDYKKAYYIQAGFGELESVDFGPDGVMYLLFNNKPDNTHYSVYKANRSSQTVSFTSAPTTKTYGDASFTIKATTTGNGAITYSSSNTDIATINASTGAVTIKGVGTTTITASAAATPDYNAASKSYTLTINKAAQTVSFTSAPTTKTYGDANFTVKATASGGGTISYSSSNTNVATINASTGVVTIKGVGTTSITASAAATANYNAASKSYTLTINKAAQTVSFTSAPTTKTYGDANFTIKATASDGGTITYSSSNTNVATINASTGVVTIKGAGSTTITASAAATANYNAGSKTYTLTINKAAQTVSFTTAPAAKIYGDANFTVAATTTGGGAITYSSSNTGVATINSSTGEVTIKGTGTTTITASAAVTANYNAASKTYTLTISKASHSITFADPYSRFPIEYGSEFENVATSTANEVAITYSSSNEEIATVDENGKVVALKSGIVTITASGGSDNYLDSSASYELSIEYVLSFDDNEGTGEVIPRRCVNTDESDTCNVTIPMDTPTRDGYYFLGWALDQEATIEDYRSGDEVILDDNLTLFAVWIDGGLVWTGGREHMTGNTEDAVIEINYPLDRFKYLTIDGVIVPEDKYDLEEGSTIITIHADYLNTLDEGRHELAVVYDDDTSIKTTIVIEKPPVEAPNTGDNTNIINNETLFNGLVAFPAILMVGLAVFYYVKKTKSSHRKFD